MSPCLTIWFRPRATLRDLVGQDPVPGVKLLVALVGIDQALERAAMRGLGSDMSLPFILMIAVVAGPFLGFIGLYISTALIQGVAVWIGGRAGNREVRAALAWAGLPIVAGLGLWIIAIAVFGGGMFTVLGPQPVSDAASVILGLIDVFWEILVIWSLVLLVNGIAEVQAFSTWKAIGNLLGTLLLVLPVLAVIWLIL